MAGFDPSALREAPVRRLAGAQLMSAVGDGMVIAVLPFAIYGMGGSDAQVGFALAVQAFAMAALFLFGGAIGDRFSRRRVVVAGDLLRFGSRAAIAILWFQGDATYWQLLLAQAVHGAGTAFFSPTMDALVPEVVPTERRQRANTLRRMGDSLGAVFGPAIGAVTFAVAGPGFAFAIDALTFLASALMLRSLATPFADPAKQAAPQRLLADIAEGWRAARQLRWFWRITTEFAVLNPLVFAPFFAIGPVVAAESLGGQGAWAWILVGMGVGELLGGWFVMTWEPTRPLLAGTLVVAIWIVPLVLMATVASVGLVTAGMVLAGASFTIFGSLWDTAKQDHAPAHLLSRLSSLDHLGSMGLNPFGFALGGVMVATVGPKVALMLGAALVAAETFRATTDPSVRGLRPGRSTGRGRLALAAGK